MYTSLDIDHLIRERNARLLREVRAERLRGRLRTNRVPRSVARRIAELLPLPRGFEPPAATPR